MSKFKVGDRVRVRNPASTMCKAGDVGVVIGVQDDCACVHRENVDNLGTGWWLADGNLEYVHRPTVNLDYTDHQPPVAHHDRVVADTHAAIDRLVAHLERQATEHVHALDALRAENEALRTQNAHLRALQAAQEAKQVREVQTGRVNGYLNMSEPGSDANKYAADQGVRQATKYDERGWALHDVDGSSAYEKATEPEAIAWVLDGVLPKR